MAENAEAEPPVLRLTWAEFKALPDYSHTTPTGYSMGQRWRRLHRYSSNHGRTIHRYWLISQVVPFNGYSLTIQAIRWTRPIIVCESGEGL